MNDNKYVTIVYEVKNMDEFQKTNPLKWEHHGLAAVQMGQGDAFEKIEELKDATGDLEDEV